MEENELMIICPECKKKHVCLTEMKVNVMSRVRSSDSCSIICECLLCGVMFKLNRPEMQEFEPHSCPAGISDLQDVCRQYLEALEEEPLEDSDEHRECIFERAMELVYRKKVWDYVNMFDA